MTPAERRKQTLIAKYGSEQALREAMAEAGRKGGKAKGESKRRDTEHYKRIGKIGGLNRGKRTKV